jgi:hypothetical protein
MALALLLHRKGPALKPHHYLGRLGEDGATAYGTFSPMQGIMQPVSPGTSRYLG